MFRHERATKGVDVFPGPLRAFHEAVQAGSIRKASDRLGLAPSSVSRQIAVLEALMGTALLNRTLGGVALTHAGALVAEYAHSAVRDFDSLRLDLDDLKGSCGLVRVAMVESIASGGPVQAAANFRKNFPGVAFDFTVLPATSVIEAVLNKTADIGISFCAEETGQIVHEATIVEPLMLLMHGDHPLSQSSRLSLTQLGDLELALPDQKFGFRRLIDRAARRLNVTIQPSMTSNSFDALRDFARSGAGATILPMRAVQAFAESYGLRSIPLDDAELSNTTLDVIRLSAWRLPRIVRLYMEELRKTLERLPHLEGGPRNPRDAEIAA